MSILDRFNNYEEPTSWEGYKKLRPGRDEVVIFDPRVEPGEDGQFHQHRHRVYARVVSIDNDKMEITVLFDHRLWKFNWKEYQKSCSENKVQS